MQSPPIRVIFATDTSGHTIGYHVVARGLRDAGFEVIMSGRLLPEEAAAAALQEDADVLAYRIMDRDPVAIGRALLDAMREQGIAETPLLLGGIIGRPQTADLLGAGAAGVFGPGSKLADIVACVRQAARRDA
jgi:methylmalonyl-CoA mutase C-terminal domain/subunit